MHRLSLWLLVFALPVAAQTKPPTERTNSLGMRLHFVDAGWFVQGDGIPDRKFSKDHSNFNTNDEVPCHPVRLSKPFYLGETEVTIAQFRQFVEATAYKTTAESSGKGSVGLTQVEGKHRLEQQQSFTWKSPGFPQTATHPVVGVSWQDAQAFCRWLSEKEGVRYRLPTEAEWEYACRAGTTTYFSFGDAYRSEIHRHANIADGSLEKVWPKRALVQWIFDVSNAPTDGHAFTAPVGSYEANPWGLRDMHGNVWEWCEDRYLDTVYNQYKAPRYDVPTKVAIDPLNEKRWNDAGEWRVIRGGSWLISPIQARSGCRGVFEAEDAACYVGFRVACAAPDDVVQAARRVHEEEQAALTELEKAVEQIRRSDDDTLRLEWSEPPSPEVAKLFPKVPRLTHLAIYGRDRVSRATLDAILAMPDLRALHLDAPGPEWNANDLANLAKKMTLQELALSRVPKLDDAALAPFAKATNLRLLRLRSSEVTDRGLRPLAGLTKLADLDLIQTTSQGEILAHLRLPDLRKLRIHVTDESAKHLGAFPSLVELNLSESPLGEAGLAGLAKLKELEQLDLRRCRNIPEDAFAVLGQLRSLRYAYLADTQAGTRAMQELAKLQRLAHVEIGGPNLTDEGLHAISGVQTLDELRISESATQLTDRGLKDLWRLSGLRGLSLRAPNITGEGFGVLAELEQLDRLGVKSPVLTDRALKYLARIPNVRFLNLEATDTPNEVTDAGLLELANARKLQRLQISRRGTKITDAGIARLRELRPKLNLQVH